MGICSTFRLFLVLCLIVAGGCTRAPSVDRTPIKAQTIAELQEYLREHKSELDIFRARGPFTFTERTNHELRLSSTEVINTDLFLASSGQKAPLVIFLHGYEASKEAHAYQAVHLASWGIHSLTLQLSKRGPWDGNGRRLARLVHLIHRSPEILDRRIDVNRIVLVGHSFGASSVSVALAEGAPAAAAVLLDPAAIGRNLPVFLQKVRKPVLVLGADDEVIPTRNRDYFFEYMRGSVAELSIKNATHEDAQYPSQTAVQNFGADPDTTEELQLAFVSALTSAVLSLASTGTFDGAWATYDAAFKSGKFFNAKRK